MQQLSAGGHCYRSSRSCKLLNEDDLSLLLEGKGAGATQTFFEDYLCGRPQETSHMTVIMVSLLQHSQNPFFSRVHTEKENIEESEPEEKDYRREKSGMDSKFCTAFVNSNKLCYKNKTIF